MNVLLEDTTIQTQRPKPAKRKILLWKRANIEGIKEDIANFVEDFNQTVFENIEQIWKFYKDKLLETGFDVTAGQSNRSKIGPLGQLIFSGHQPVDFSYFRVIQYRLITSTRAIKVLNSLAKY